MVTSHPIQYQVPVFRCLAAMEDLEFSVLFAMIPDAAAQGSGFGVEFEWDVPLLEGYAYQVLENVASEPSVTSFSGCDTPGVFKALKSLRPDAVVVNGWVVKTCLQTLWACKRLDIPCLVRGEANNLRTRPIWKRWLQLFLVKQYAACLYIGAQNRTFYTSLGVDESKLFHSPYCVDNERFENSAIRGQQERQEFRSKWHIPPDAVCFLFCGKFEDKKHPLELLEALGRANSPGLGLHLLMVGDGALRARCEAIAAVQQWPVTFTGFLNQSEIISAYLAADCLVLPSDAGETWGLVVNEAMSCGLPALVSDLAGCASDLIHTGVTGEIFHFGDWSVLSDLLARYARDKATLPKMGNSASSLIRQYSPQNAAVGIREAACAVMQRNGHRGP